MPAGVLSKTWLGVTGRDRASLGWGWKVDVERNAL